MSIKVKPLSQAIGAEILDLDLSEVMEPDFFAEVYETFLQYGLIVFRGQQITPDQQIRLSGRFGMLNVHPMKEARHLEFPELIVLGNRDETSDKKAEKRKEPRAYGEVDKTGTVGRIPWHSDLTYTSKPSIGAVIYALEVPPEGGETAFIDIARVYDELPEDVQQKIEGLEAVHWLGTEDEPSDARFEKVTHPLVLIHPETGRKALNISPFFVHQIVGMDGREGQELLEWLTDFATQPKFAYYHEWEVGDVLIWDNRRTMHHATGWDHKHRRVLHRTTIGGIYDLHQVLAA